MIILEFHILYSNHSHFLVLPGLSFPFDLPSQKRGEKDEKEGRKREGKKRREEKEKCTKSSCPYAHWSMVKLTVASPLKKTESFPTLPPQKPSTVKNYTLASCHNF